MLFTVNIVSAIPPVQTTTSLESGLTIEYPKFDELASGIDYDFHIHVFNSSNGVNLTNETVDCLLHFYYPNGTHSLEESMGYDSNGVDFVYMINGSFLEEEKTYYIIQCQTKDETLGGFASGGFRITETGLTLEKEMHLVLISFHTFIYVSNNWIILCE